MALSNQDYNLIINNWGIEDVTKASFPDPTVAKNSISTDSKLVKNLSLILNILSGVPVNSDDKTSQFKLYQPPTAPNDVVTKNGSVTSKSRILSLLRSGYVYFAPINYFVLPEHLSRLLAAHSRKSKKINIDNWLYDLLRQVNVNQLFNNYGSLFVRADPNDEGSIQRAAEVLYTIAGDTQVNKPSQEVIYNRAINRMINGIMYVNADVKPIKVSYEQLPADHKAAVDALHPPDTRTSKTLAEKVIERLADLSNMVGSYNWVSNYSLKISSADKNGNHSVTVSRVESQPTVGIKTTKNGSRRYTIDLANILNNRIYLIVGSDIADNTQQLNQLERDVNNQYFTQLSKKVSDVRNIASQQQQSGGMYSQLPSTIAYSNQMDAAEAFSRMQGGQPLPVIQQFQPPQQAQQLQPQSGVGEGFQPQQAQQYPPVVFNPQEFQPQQAPQAPQPQQLGEGQGEGFQPQQAPQVQLGEGLGQGDYSSYSSAPATGPIGEEEFNAPPQAPQAGQGGPADM